MSQFSKDELDRVIRRAVELQFEEGSDRDAGHGLDEAEVLRIGGEVGIERHFLKRAIGEVRAGSLLSNMPAERGVLSTLVGPHLVRAYRVVQGTVEEIDATVADHLRVAESLTPIRTRPGYSVWEREAGLLAGIRRSVGRGGYRYELARTNTVDITVTEMEDGFALVVLVADLRRIRGEAAAGGAFGIGTVGATAGFVAALLAGAPFVTAPAVALAGPAITTVAGVFGGMRVSSGVYRRSAERIRLTLEGILDRLETGIPLARRRSRGSEAPGQGLP